MAAETGGARISQPSHVKIENGTKTFGRGPAEFTAVKDFNLDLRRGEFLGLLGPSGCGKSTLLNCVAGLEPLTTGSVLIDGQQISGPPDDLGMVFQSDALADWLSVIDNVLLVSEFRQRRPREEVLDRALGLLDTFGLIKFKDKRPWELSGGMRQRAAICRALADDPSLLLMDEPFGALDAMTRDQLNLELQRIWQKSQKTVLFVTHGIVEAVFLSDRVAIMSRNPGQLIKVIDIDLPRPRKLAIRESPEFIGYVKEIMDVFLSLGILSE